MNFEQFLKEETKWAVVPEHGSSAITKIDKILIQTSLDNNLQNTQTKLKVCEYVGKTDDGMLKFKISDKKKSEDGWNTPYVYKIKIKGE